MTNETQNSTKKDPGIRTMRTDIAEYLKETKPSLLSILTKEMKSEELVLEPGYKLKMKSRRLPLFGALVVLILLAGGGYWTVSRFGSKGGGGEIIAPPKPVFASEKTKTVLARDSSDLMRNLQLLGDELERDGVITKIDMRFREGANVVLFSPETFLRAIGAKPPAEFYTNHTPVFHPFLYSDRGVPRFGALFVSRNGARSLQEMLSWEPAIQRDLEPLFLGRLPESAIGVFTDKRYRNINYRFLSLSRSEDFGIGYFLFGIKNYLVITTSEHAIEAVISRLFEAN